MTQGKLPPFEIYHGDGVPRPEVAAELPSSSALFEEAGSYLADNDVVEGERAAETKHRNIPTWSDAVQGMVDANIENHRRNENRGSRGRPRGRR